MALRHRAKPLWGVQFHPESIGTEYGAKLMRRFFELSQLLTPPRPKRAATPAANARSLKIPSQSLRLFAFPLTIQRDPVRVFARLYGSSRTAFWLDSSLANGEHAGRWSYMGNAAGPRAAVVRCQPGQMNLEIHERKGVSYLREHIFDYLDRQMQARQVTAVDIPFGFTCGYVGYFGYEAHRQPGCGVERIDPPNASWIFADRVVAFDHHTNAIWLLCLDAEDGMCEENAAWVRDTQRGLYDSTALDAAAAYTVPCELRWRHTGSAYRRLIERAQELLREGETYEVCLTNQLTGSCSVEPTALYTALRQINPAPYSAFFRVDDTSIACSSPELFLHVNSDRIVHSRPIKGTARRSADVTEDRRRAAALQSSVKDRAENLMIVDLLRNDLNRICDPGSVQVPQLFAVETYTSVHQLVSTVSGRLRADVSVIDCVRAAFPGGSMTGAPKVRTMQILEALEAGPRGPYSGALGYFSTNNTAKLNIIIRSIVMNRNQIAIGAGGAIVSLSQPQDEMCEVDLKVAHLVKAVQQCVAVCWQPLSELARREFPASDCAVDDSLT
jgi:para-aminobenzoate synthetase